MRKFLLIAGLILALCGSGFAQSPDNSLCPTISVSGPTGIVEPGEIASYTVRVDSKGKQYNLEYKWSVSAGKIVSGQGTTNLGVRVPERETLTVTIEIKGLPDGCPSILSETKACGLKKPEAVKIGEISEAVSQSAKAVLDRAVKGVNDNPNDQLYVLSGYVGGRPFESVRAKERKVLDYLVENGVEKSRVTFVGVYAEVELMQLWQVPPGADAPRCAECEELEKAAKMQSCPTISVSGPAGIVGPGEMATFTVEIPSANQQPPYEYLWEVTKGQILVGQGTTTIRVTLRDFDGVTATVNVKGLPVGCPNSASERYSIIIDPGPIKLGEIYGLTYGIEKKLLAKIETMLHDQPNAQLYIVLPFKRGTPQNNMRRSRTRLANQLAKSKIEYVRMTFFLADNDKTGAVFWLIPPGVSYPLIDK